MLPAARWRLSGDFAWRPMHLACEVKAESARLGRLAEGGVPSDMPGASRAAWSKGGAL